SEGEGGGLWFGAISAPVAIELEITVGIAEPARRGNETTLSEVASWVGAKLLRDGYFTNLGFLSNTKIGMLTFVEARPFLAAALASEHVSCVLTTNEFAADFPEHVALAVADDPKRCFFTIHNRLPNETEFYGEDFPSIVHPSARLHPRSWIDEKNVTIGAGVTVAANAVVLGRAVIGEGATIYTGAVIGSTGFQTNR